MGEQLALWYREQGEYVTGALFGLVALDIFMFLVHCIIEQTAAGYSLTTLVITLGLFFVAYVERLYGEQEAAH